MGIFDIVWYALERSGGRDLLMSLDPAFSVFAHLLISSNFPISCQTWYLLGIPLAIFNISKIAWANMDQYSGQLTTRQPSHRPLVTSVRKLSDQLWPTAAGNPCEDSVAMAMCLSLRVQSSSTLLFFVSGCSRALSPLSYLASTCDASTMLGKVKLLWIVSRHI